MTFIFYLNPTFVFCLNFIKMKQTSLLFLVVLLMASCTSQKKLAYLQNLPEPTGQESFPMDIPDYKLQPRDILYITAKAMNPEGKIEDFLSSNGSSSMYTAQSDVSGSLFGYTVNPDGIIVVPGIGEIKVAGLNLEETRQKIRNWQVKYF